MGTNGRCPRCGAPLARGGALEGLCPACLLAERGRLRRDSAAELVVTAAGAGTEPAPPVPDPEELRRLFPDLELEELVGRGGMGVVYRARQKHLDRLVALKLLAPEVAGDPAFAERFLREARAMARLDHPNVVRVHDFGSVEGRFYLLLEYVDGTSLRDVIRNERLAPAHALSIVRQLCDGLAYAHERGVVHRDVKPENVLLDRSGRVKIADFGLAKLAGQRPGERPLTRVSQVMGTPHYMAPEQVDRPLEVDHRADIYALGVVLYELLTGELPLGPFEPPSRKVEVDVRLDAIVLRALEREPARRYQSAVEVRTDVERISSGAAAAPAVQAVPAVPSGDGGPPWPPPWLARVPGGPVWVGLAALLGAWGWVAWMRATAPLGNEEWVAVAYPLAFLALVAARRAPTRARSRFARVALLALAIPSAVAVLLALGEGMGPWTSRLPMQVLAATTLLCAHLVLDGGLRCGRAARVGAGAGLVLLAAIMHASLERYGRTGEALAYASGMGALLCAASLAVWIPEYVAGEPDRRVHRAVLGATALGLVLAAFYFRRFVF